MHEWKAAIGRFTGLDVGTYLQTLQTGGDVQLLNVKVVYTATGTTGTRLLVFQVLDFSANVIVHLTLPAALTIIASEVKTLQASISIVTSADWTANYAQYTLPAGIILPGRHYFRVIDSAAIDASDGYTLEINFASYHKGAFAKVTP